MKKAIWAVMIMLVAAPAFAISGVSVGIKGGLVNNYDQAGLTVGSFSVDRMNFAGAQARIRTIPIIDLILSGDYAWKTNDYDFAGQNFQLKTHDLSFNATLAHTIKLPILRPYAGAGIGSHHLTFDYLKPMSLSLSDNGITVPNSETRIGYHLTAGFEIGISAFPIGLGAEYRINWIDTPGEVTKYNSFTVGLNVNLP
jgi:opacity protein-like surface antigen